MPFEIGFDEEQGCIISVFTGKITMSLVYEYIAALLPVLEESGCRRLLSDSRDAELQLSSMDIMQFPKLAQGSPLTAELKRAVLASPGTSGYDLYETLSEVMGQHVQVFNDPDEAMAWLTDDTNPS